MTNITTPTKRSRRLGVRFIPKLDKYLTRRPGPAAKSRRRKKITEYGAQLMEKQKAKFFYNLRERQFARYIEKAMSSERDSSEILVQLLETRLDNILVRAGFAVTRYQAKQLISHGHIKVNDKKINIPSYHCRPGEVISFKTVIYHDEKADAPIWLDVDHKKNVVAMKNIPSRGTITSDLDFEHIISFYSR